MKGKIKDWLDEPFTWSSDEGWEKALKDAVLCIRNILRTERMSAF